MKLTAENVDKLFEECTSPDGEQVEGIVIRIKLKTDGHEVAIGQLLSQLPDEFHADRGGGWSFLNSCTDRDGEQWTGLHTSMEKLLMLGLAAKQATLLMPRDMWQIFPGGMPYFSVKPLVGGVGVEPTTSCV